MRLILLLFVSIIYMDVAIADQAYDRAGDKTYEGLLLTANSKGFKFRVNCFGPARYFSWGSPRENSGASYKRTRSCRQLQVGLTAGSDSGGDCDDWRDGVVLLIGFLNVPEGNWRYARGIEAGGFTIKIRALNGDVLSGDLKDVGVIRSIDGVCRDGGGVPRGSLAGLPASFRIIRQQ